VLAEASSRPMIGFGREVKVALRRTTPITVYRASSPSASGSC
jgi:hypothetical protein